MIDEAYMETLVQQMRLWKIPLAPGLTDAEVTDVEHTYDFRFPPDLRFVLQYALPVAPEGRRYSWINWREDPEEWIRERFDWPAEGICFDIEHDNFWMERWGPRPARLDDAFRIARDHIRQEPKLVPIHSHRYLPEEPFLPGNPVFSVLQTDIVYYGYDLATHFACEFRVRGAVDWEYPVPVPEWAAQSPRPIRFWSDLVILNREDSRR